MFFILHHRPQHPDNHYPPGTKKIQKALVEIWQSHIDDWYSKPENFVIDISESFQPDNQDIDKPPLTPSDHATSQEPVARNGHVLKLIPEGGVFCQNAESPPKTQNSFQALSE